MKIINFIFYLVITILSFNVEKKKEVIVIDPGHGGVDGGCVYNDIKESDINLSVSIKLKEVLSDTFDVYLTREADISLSKDKFHKREDLINRVNLINSYKPILFISIHQNKFSTNNVYGFQINYNNINEDNIILAKSICNNIGNVVLKNRGIVFDKSVYILKKLPMPGCLIECGFLSNENDRLNILNDSYQYKLVNKIKDGIIDYLMIKDIYI